MEISEIIGLTIKEIRYEYNYQNDYGLQEFFAYLKLSNGIIMEIPQYVDMNYKISSEMDKMFANCKKPSKSCRKTIENQKIIDIHFCFYNQETDEEKKSYVELENGLFITEENRGPMGVTSVDLEILTKSKFNQLKLELEDGFEIKSYLAEIKNVC